MRSTRSRAPESGPKRQGPNGRKRTAKLGLEPAGDMLFDKLVRELGARNQGLQSPQIGPGKQLLLGSTGSVKAAAAPGQLQVRHGHSPAAARSAAAQAVVFE